MVRVMVRVRNTVSKFSRLSSRHQGGYLGREMSRRNVLIQRNNLYGEAHEIGNANGVAGVVE